jgi:MIP family channel proteins
MAVPDVKVEEREKKNAHSDAFAPVTPFVLFRRLFTEAVGTFLLVTIDCGGAMAASLSHGDVTPLARSLATGLIVMAMSSAMADVSGAHFNPAVTAAFAMRGAFPWSKVPAYWAAQIAGALVASFVLLASFGNVDHLGATEPGVVDAGHAFVVEIVITTVLVLISLGTATRHRVLGPQAAIAVGGTIAACTLIARPFSGASMNPARSLAPALVSHHLESVWIYVTAPFIGACIACAILFIVHHKRHSEEREAAGGEPK